MAGRPRKPVEDRIAEKEKIISGIQIRLKAEQKELEVLFNEKKIKDLENLDALLNSSGLSLDEAAEALENYANLKQENAS